MNMIHKIALELMQQQEMPRIHVRQGDAYSRTVEITLTAEGKPWNVPGDAGILIRFRALDTVTGECADGIYDMLEDTKAWSVAKNVVTIRLAPQMLAEQGLVQVDLVFRQGDTLLATGMFEIYVNQVAVNDMIPRLADYENVQSLRDAGHVDVLLDTTTTEMLTYVSTRVSTGKVYSRIAVMCETLGTASNASCMDLAVVINGGDERDGGIQAGYVYGGVGNTDGESIWADVSVFSGGHYLSASYAGGQAHQQDQKRMVFFRHGADLTQPITSIRVQTKDWNGYFGLGSHIRILGIRA